MRNVSRRSFTVEVKSVGRRSAAIIPTRVAAPPAPATHSIFSPPAVAREPAAEKRRVLPNLIVPEVPDIEAAPPPVAEEAAPRRPRGRPRKNPLPFALPVEVPILAKVEAAAVAEPETVVSPEPAAPSLTGPRKRKDLPVAELPRGERWKTRRLGRWSR